MHLTFPFLLLYFQLIFYFIQLALIKIYSIAKWDWWQNGKVFENYIRIETIIYWLQMFLNRMTLLILVPNQKNSRNKEPNSFHAPIWWNGYKASMFMKNISCVIKLTWSLWQHPRIGRCLKFKTIHLLII